MHLLTEYLNINIKTNDVEEEIGFPHSDNVNI